MSQTVVFLKTHVWNNNIEEYAFKIYLETSVSRVDYYILLHDEGSLYSQIISPDLRKRTLKFTEVEIKKLYPQGYYDIRTSNHWIMMWFYHQYPNYQYYWSMEYDLRIHGNSNIIWNYHVHFDLLYPRGFRLGNNNMYRDKYCGGRLSDNEKYYGYLQLSRYSNRFLMHLDKVFQSGENGQDELIIFSIIKRDGFTHSQEFLSKMIKGYWTWEPKYSNINRIMLDNLIEPGPFILHPIK